MHRFKRAVTRYKSGDMKTALAMCRDIVADNPQTASACHLLGLVLLQLRDPGAEDCLKQAFTLDSANPEYARDLAAHYRKSGSPEKSVEILSGLAERGIRSAAMFFELGEAFRDQKKFDTAAWWYGEASRLDSSMVAAHINHGSALLAGGNYPKAATAFESALNLVKNDYRIYWMAARSHARARQAALAIPHFQAAIRLCRSDYELLCEFGELLLEGYDLSGAKACFAQALGISKDSVLALHGLAQTLARSADIQMARHYFERELSVAASAISHSDLLFLMNHDQTCTSDELFGEHRAWEKAYATTVSLCTFTNSRELHRQIRIGYLSPDFNAHPVGYFIEPLLKHHSADVHVSCFDNTLRKDKRTDELRSFAKCWHETASLPDQALTEFIRKEQIDILVDLAGHTSGNRLLAMAGRAAPLQVTYLGYPNTTGLTAIDYRFTDTICDPPERDRYHTEKLIRIPGCFLCYAPPSYAPPVVGSRTPAESGIVFGSFNRLLKINTFVIGLWARLLQSIPNSLLLIKTGSFNDPATRERIAGQFAQHGIDTSRIELRCATGEPADHLATYAEIDIALDTFPYSGTTTTCEALWMGVPVVTLTGQMHASRVSASILSALSLPDLIGKSGNDYLSIAGRLASDPARLVSLRASLHEMMLHSPLCDGAAFTTRLELIYRELWQRWCTAEN